MRGPTRRREQREEQRGANQRGDTDQKAEEEEDQGRKRRAEKKIEVLQDGLRRDIRQQEQPRGGKFRQQEGSRGGKLMQMQPKFETLFNPKNFKTLMQEKVYESHKKKLKKCTRCVLELVLA